MKVMIVEDSEAVRRMIISFIEDLIEEFVEIEDGCLALAAYTQHHPDLVLMDIEMKEMDGFDATREIKSAFPKARVLIVSQWESAALREAASFAGAEGYVNKANLLPLREILEAGEQKA